jgi:DNA anti-recombination protein RmuC
MVWVLFAALFVVMAVVLWTRSSLKKAMTDVGVQVQAASAPVQGLGPVVASVNQAVTNLGSGITAISVQAEKIATLGLRYEEAERLTKDIHAILVGSYSKGRAGEEALRRSMNELMKMGYVRAKLPIGGGVVEYAIVFKDGTVVPIDSKIVSTDEITGLFDEKVSAEERAKLADRVRRKVREKIPEVQKYIDPPNTLPLAIMCVPDSVIEIVGEVIPEAMERKVILLGYSAVPQLIGYFVQIHGFYAIEEDVAELRDRISRAQQEVSRLDDRFFANRFEKPLGTVNGAISLMKEVASRLRYALTYEESVTAEPSLEKSRREKEVVVSARR